MLDVNRTQVGSAMAHLREVWSELNYAQRRALELRTGLSFANPDPPTVARTVEDLEALFARS